LLIFSDLHANQSHPIVGCDFLSLSVNALKQIREHALTTNDKVVIHVGDWTHLKDRIYTKVWNAIFEELKIWEQNDIASYWLKGNHDFATDASIQSFYISSCALPIISPQVIHIQNIQCVFLPYGSTIKDVGNLKINYEKQVVIFLHDSFKGVTKLANNIIAIDGWDLKDFGASHFVFAGHAHGFQELIEGRVFHIGSPYQVSFNEVGQKKYFLQFDGCEVTPYEFSFPKFIEHNMGESLSKRAVHGAYIKIKYVSGEWTNSQIQECKQEFYNYGAIKVKAEAQNVKGDKKERMEVQNSTTDYDFISNYVNLVGTTLDKSLLRKLGQELIGGK
jgi:DNA repair exonuclease SbcCD nuclease subunit